MSKSSSTLPEQPQPKIRLLLVDDHEVVRSGLRMLLENEPDLVIVGEASTGSTALELAQALGPDIVLMDITLPGSVWNRCHTPDSTIRTAS